MRSVSIVRYQNFLIEVENEIHSSGDIRWNYSLYYLFNNTKFKLCLTPNLARGYKDYKSAVSLAKGEIDNHLDELTPIID